MRDGFVDWTLNRTHRILRRLGLPEVKGFMYLNEKNWPGSQEGLPSWCFLWADNGQGRWIPIPFEMANAVVQEAAKVFWLSLSLHEDPDKSNRVSEDCEWASVGRYDPEHARAGEDGFVWFNGGTVGQAVIAAFLGERKSNE